MILLTTRKWLSSCVFHNPAAMQDIRVWSLDWEDLLEKGMATHSSLLAWRIPWTEEPGRLQSMGLQRVGHQQFFVFLVDLRTWDFWGLSFEMFSSKKGYFLLFLPPGSKSTYQSEISLAPPKDLRLMSV